MKHDFDFDRVIDRRGTWCTQWDYVEDRFGAADLLPFTISDMDFGTAPAVLEAVRRRLEHPVLGYSRWKNGDFESAVEHWYESRFGCRIDPEEVVYAPSVIYLVARLIRLWSAPGDGVVTHTPCYDAFPNVITQAGRKLVPAPLTKGADGGWTCDFDRLGQLLAAPANTVLLLCSPHNPTGTVWPAETLERIAELCERYGVRVISDEIHMDLARPGHPHRPWAEFGRGDWAIATSASKSFNIPALTGAYGIIHGDRSRDGYLIQLKAADGLSSPAVLSLVAHIAAYNEGAPWLDALRAYLRGNLRMVEDKLNEAFPQLRWQPPQAGYLAWIDLRPLEVDDAALQQELIRRQRVAIMPGETYGEDGQGFVRLNVGCPRSKAEAGVDALVTALRRLHKGA
ncbi:pyridoxal phosphate-dependent aminotransferase [Streptomyces sp. A7024]|uniref:cysteine-S-conjugate beta-lyase n=1 Tax=Streptomyces coryli TaxID=1128680 RepID=A0A6G4U3U9_9ACTN|nr:MalY/PatB family protein [Streptomyces coryli]NGN66763.1 pyridoxal phosphate-dependent aminotransferase [Streptomyces coryli]